MKEKLLAACCIILSTNVMAQTDSLVRRQKMVDSITMSYYRQAALIYPILRQVSLSTEMVGKSKVHSKLHDEDLYKADASIIRYRANVTMPVWQNRKNIISGSFNYLGQHAKLDNGINYNPSLPINQKSTDGTTLNLIASYTRRDSLFNMPVSLSFSASALTDGQFNQVRMTYGGTVAFTLKQTAGTNLVVGLTVTADPASPVPLIPFMSYAHRFADRKTALFVDLPQRIMLRRAISTRSSLSLASQLGSSLFFINAQNALIPSENLFTTLDIKSGLQYEYLAGKYVVLGINGGLWSTVQSRVFEKSETSNHYFVANKSNSAPFVQFSVSILPFVKGFH